MGGGARVVQRKSSGCETNKDSSDPHPQEPWTSPRSIDFGEGVGMKPVWLLDNPDVPTCHAALGVRSLSSRFGTAPLFWNYLFGAMKAVPKSLLQNQDAMQVWITKRITKTEYKKEKMALGNERCG